MSNPPPRNMATSDSKKLFLIFDPEVNRENPIELMYHKLDRSQDGYMIDKDLKPKVPERKQIAVKFVFFLLLPFPSFLPSAHPARTLHARSIHLHQKKKGVVNERLTKKKNQEKITNLNIKT